MGSKDNKEKRRF